MKSRTYLKRKEVDDVLGGDESWGNQTTGMFSFSTAESFLMVTDAKCSTLSQVRTPNGSLHGAPNQICRRANDHLYVRLYHSFLILLTCAASL